MTEKRKYERHGLSSNDKRKKLKEDAYSALSILKSWIFISEDGSFEPTGKFTETVNEFFNELHSIDSQTVL